MQPFTIVTPKSQGPGSICQGPTTCPTQASWRLDREHVREDLIPLVTVSVQHRTYLLEFNTLSSISQPYKLVCHSRYRSGAQVPPFSAARTASPANTPRLRLQPRSQTSHSAEARTPFKRDLNTRQHNPSWFCAISIALWRRVVQHDGCRQGTEGRQ